MLRDSCRFGCSWIVLLDQAEAQRGGVPWLDESCKTIRIGEENTDQAEPSCFVLLLPGSRADMARWIETPLVKQRRRGLWLQVRASNPRSRRVWKTHLCGLYRLYSYSDTIQHGFVKKRRMIKNDKGTTVVINTRSRIEERQWSIRAMNKIEQVHWLPTQNKGI